MAKLPKATDTVLAFAEVALAVQSLYDLGGMAAIRDVLRRVRGGEDAREATAKATNRTWRRFEKAWRASMAKNRGRADSRGGKLRAIKRKYRGKNARLSGRPLDENAYLTADDPSKRFMRLGNMLLSRNRPEAASIEYRKGAELAGDNKWVFLVKQARALLLLNDPEAAANVMAPVRANHPELPWPHAIYGEARLNLNDLAGAIEAFNASIAINPFDPGSHCQLWEAMRQSRGSKDKEPQPLMVRAKANCQALVQATGR